MVKIWHKIADFGYKIVLKMSEIIFFVMHSQKDTKKHHLTPPPRLLKKKKIGRVPTVYFSTFQVCHLCQL